MPPTALITGGARGIGRAIATDLARDHNVVLTWNTTQPDALPDIPPEGVHTIRADLTQTGSCAAIIDEVIARFGQLDVIVNNAGLGQPTPADRFDAIAARAILDVNLLGARRPSGRRPAASATERGDRQHFLHKRSPAATRRRPLRGQQGGAEPLDPRHGQGTGTALYPRQRRRHVAIPEVHRPQLPVFTRHEHPTGFTCLKHQPVTHMGAIGKSVTLVGPVDPGDFQRQLIALARRGSEHHARLHQPNALH
jgi:short subunit dehydrogenase